MDIDQFSSSTGYGDPIRSTKAWLPDGNVILQAESMMFKVHRSVLSRHSSVFADMFAMPQPATTIQDGEPVVPLQNSALDIETMLETMYGHRCAHSVGWVIYAGSSRRGSSNLHSSRVPFSWAASIIRMGRKYMIDEFLRLGMDRINYECPSTLEEFRTQRQSFTQFDGYRGLDIDIVNFLEEMGPDYRNPIAYYMVAYVNINRIVEGQNREDGSRADLLPYVKIRVLAGRARLLQTQIRALCVWDEAIKGVCNDRDHCKSREAFLDMVTTEDIEASEELLVGWQGVMNEDYHLCDPCDLAGRLTFERCGPPMWAELPSYFDLPGWA